MMGDLLKRFDGPENAGRCKQALLSQKLIFGDANLADQFLAKGTLRELKPGEVLITQGAWDTDWYLILAGSLDIQINGQPIGKRAAGEHVGELSGADPGRPRTATVLADADALVLQISEAAVNEIAGKNADFWRRALNVAGDRLDERNAKLGKTNEIPRVFVISSSEGLRVAEEVVRHLDGKEIAVQLWNKGTFGLSDYPISSLMDAIEGCDFTIAVVRADDSLVIRGEKAKAARDNVHLEYGISLGMLGRLRSLLLVCETKKKGKALHRPTDTAGLNTLRYRDDTDDEMQRSVRTACLEAKQHILREGVFRRRRTR